METKVLGRRIGGFIIDLILAWLVVAIAAIALLESLEVPGGSALGQDGCELITDEYPLCFYTDDTYVVGTGGDTVALIAIGLAAWLVLRIIPQGINGRTLGKKVFGIKVVNEAGSPPGFGKSLLREFLWIVDSLPALYIVGLVTSAVSKNNQRVGDMAASTLVVRANAGYPAAGHPNAGYPGDAGTAPGGYPTGPGTDQPPGAGGGYPAGYPTESGGVAPTDPGTGFPASGTGNDDPVSSAPPPTGQPLAEPGQPVWDPVRNAYIYRDPDTGREQIYDQASGQWRDT